MLQFPHSAPLYRTAALVFLMASCANTGMPRTGFLEDYASLKNAPEHEVGFVPDSVDLYVHPELESRSFGSVVIDPVVYRPSADVAHQPDAEAIEKLTRYFHRKLRRTLHPTFEIVQVPRADSLRVRAAIAEVHPANSFVNIITLVLLLPVDMGGVAGEIEVLDANTDERLLAMTATRDGSPLLIWESFTKYGYARHGLAKWSKKLLELLGGEE